MSFKRIFWTLLLTLLLANQTALASEKSDSNKKSKKTQQKDEAASKALVSVGELAPDFTVTDTENKEFKLSNEKGHLVVVDFFATWCPPCRAELPQLEKKVWQRYQDKGLKVVLVGREHDVNELKEFKQKQEISMQVTADPKREVFAKYAKNEIPRTFVVDKDGKVLFESVGYDKAEFRKMTKLIANSL